MSQWLGFTNQKLYQARLLLDERRKQSSNPVMVSAMTEGALYLMYDAWVSYLNELAGPAGVKQSVDSFERLLQITPLVTGEMTELKNLRDETDSWLSIMLAMVADQAQPSSAQSGASAQAVQLIAVSRPTATADARDLWQALSDLIDSQRQNRQES